MKSFLFKSSVWAGKKRVLDETGQAVTRRVIKPQALIPDSLPEFQGDFSVCGHDFIAPYRVGEVVYIKEAHYAYGHWTKFHESGRSHWEFFRDPDSVIHFADTVWQHALTKPSTREGWYKRSPLFLEAQLARYFCEITEVRAERLQEITEEDALKEGVAGGPGLVPVMQFISLWSSLYGPESWGTSPWLWRIAFKRVERPTK